MSTEHTLSIIKPDAVAGNHIGAIIHRFEKAGLYPIAMKMLNLSNEIAEAFYKEHKDRGFFKDLIQFMTSGPVVVSVLSGNNAVQLHRKLLGATDPEAADKGTIRADFATSIDENAAHGSDSIVSAEREINFFFDQKELCLKTR